MKRTKRNRRIRGAASLVLALFFVLWIASFTTAVARFDSHSIFIFAQGKFTLITSEDVLVEHRGQDIHQAFVEAAAGLVDRETASNWYFTDTYDMAFPLPAWDFASVDVSRLFEKEFWNNRCLGFSKFAYQDVCDLPDNIGGPMWNTIPLINKKNIEIPIGTPLLIASFFLGVIFWRFRSYPPGHCQQCNYDLYKNTSNTCPECGTATENYTPSEKANLA